MTPDSLSRLLIESAASNVIIALPFGVVAWWLQRRAIQPFLAHLLWLLVLVKLLTPPLYSLGIAIPETDAANAGASLPGAIAGLEAAIPDPGWLAALDWRLAVAGLWLLGSILALVWSSLRAVRFDRLLRAHSRAAPPQCRRAASEIAARLGLRAPPEIMTTTARISPMVWWIGGPVRVYLPESMIGRLNPSEIEQILAHEIGHLRRGDHFVRWLECIAGVALWWNPLAWWARRNLRICEEICCDAFVLETTNASRDAYAGALISAMELVAAPTVRPRGMASHVNGGFIERRIRMILSANTTFATPRWMRGVVLAGAALVLPLGLSLAQDTGDIERVEQWLRSGVNSAFLTEEQAKIMLRALQLSEQQMITLLDQDGNPVKVNRRVAVAIAGDGQHVSIDATAAPAELEKAMAFAKSHFDEQAASGQISPEEADAIMKDLKQAIASGLAEGDGTAYYDAQFEIGLIDRETADRRRQMIADMEQAWNASPQSVEISLDAESSALTEGRQLVKVAAFPVEVKAEVEAESE